MVDRVAEALMRGTRREGFGRNAGHIRAFGEFTERVLADKANAIAQALMAPGNALQGQYNEVEVSPDGSVAPFSTPMLDAAANMAGVVGVGGSVVPRPANSLGMFGGVKAVTADMAALEKAQVLEAAGGSRDEIWNLTGWFKGADGQWRFEIDDSASQFSSPSNAASMPDRMTLAEQKFSELTGLPGMRIYNKEGPERTAAFSWADEQLESMRGNAQTNPLSEVLSHPAIYEAYPSTAGIGTAKETLNGYAGSFKDNTITYGGQSLSGQAPDSRSVLLHELQHAIQHQEGFATGGNLATGKLYEGAEVEELQRALEGTKRQAAAQIEPQAIKFFEDRVADIERAIERKAGREYYRRTAGEVEARNVQTRMNMTPEQRKAQAPWTTQDTPDNLQILRMLSNS